tara:strand:+ start:3772 stop:3972 length:201 start_codon:yes stop_codon:yes gene_type:complete
MEEGNANELQMLSHEFEMAKMKRLISNIEDINELKVVSLHLLDLLDASKMMLATMIEEEALKKKYQ